MFHGLRDIVPTQTQAAGFAPPLTSPQYTGRNGQPSLDAVATALWLARDELTARDLSRSLTQLSGRPVLVVDLAAMPHAPTTRTTGNHSEEPFTRDQLAERARYLAREARETLPEAKSIWQKWKWLAVSAKICAPNVDELTVKGGPEAEVAAAKQLPSRLTGESWNKAAVIFAPDRRWTEQQEWANITGLGGRLERYPAGSSVRTYLSGHETAHVLQRRQGLDQNSASAAQQNLAKWLIEYDADKMEVNGLRQLGLRLKQQSQREGLQGTALEENRQQRQELMENAVGIKHMRAINGFLYSTPRYWVALALDNPRQLGLLPEPRDRDDKPTVQAYAQSVQQAADKSFLSGYELRWRVAAQLEGKPLTEDSAALQAKIKDWRDNPGPAQSGTARWELNYWFSDIFSRDKKAKSPDEPKNNFYWGAANDVTQAIPALRQVIASGAITDPLTRRNGELVLQAAEFFVPSLKQQPTMAMRPTAAFPQPLVPAV